MPRGNIVDDHRAQYILFWAHIFINFRSKVFSSTFSFPVRKKTALNASRYQAIVPKGNTFVPFTNLEICHLSTTWKPKAFLINVRVTLGSYICSITIIKTYLLLHHVLRIWLAFLSHPRSWIIAYYYSNPPELVTFYWLDTSVPCNKHIYNTRYWLGEHEFNQTVPCVDGDVFVKLGQLRLWV